MEDRYYYENKDNGSNCYKGTSILINKFHILNGKELEELEREITSLKHAKFLKEPIPKEFDYEYLFEDIYDWAGQLRNVDIAKGNLFCRSDFLQQFGNDIFISLKKESYLVDLPRNEFIKRLAYYFGEINALHPFREGNGRTQRIFVERLSLNAGYILSFNKITLEEMLEASLQSFDMNYDLLITLLDKAISGSE